MTDEAIIAYLLEELPEDAVEQFEDECFAQENWPTQISLVEGDLIDDYLRNQLSPERRQRFEQNYLTTEARQERVSMAAALLRHIDECNAVSGPAVAVAAKQPSGIERFRAFWAARTFGFRAVAGIALIAILSGASWLLFFSNPSPRTFATLNLTISSSNRAEGAQIGRIKLPPRTDDLKIALTVPKQSPTAARYRVELENDNRQSKSVEVIGYEDESVLLVIPTVQLSRGQYALKLFAVQTDGSEQRINGSYYFLIE
jgi:hypothetical protein